MRSSSGYYSSLSTPYGGGSSTNYTNRSPPTTHQQLRSSFGSPSSSSYVTRSHLPYVPQTMLVAHAIAGSSSHHTKPISSSYMPYNSTSGSSYLSPSYTSRNSYTTSSYTASRAPSTKRSNPYLNSSSSMSNYTSPSSSTSSSLYRRDSSRLGNTSSAYLRPSTSHTSSSYLYRPIRLRDRPLLTQISRQFQSIPRVTNSRTYSTTRTSRRASPGDEAPIITPSSNVQQTPDEKPENLKISDKQPPGIPDEANWSSDIGRNISRNKYLIKFREVDKRPGAAWDDPIVLDTSGEPVVEEFHDEPSKLDNKPEELKQSPEIEPSVDKSPSSVIVEDGQRVELPTSVDITTENMRIELTPKQIEVSKGEQATEKLESETPKEESVAKVEQQTEIVPVAETKKKPKRVIKLKIKNVNPVADEPQQDDERRQSQQVAQPTTNDVSDKKVPQSPVAKITKPKRVVKTKSKTMDVDKENGQKTPKSPKTKPTIPRMVEPSKDLSPTAKNEPIKEAEPVVRVPLKQETVIQQKPDDTKKPEESRHIDDQPVSSANNQNKRIRYRQYNYDDFNFISVLGHGGWGFVVLAELKQHDACFAVKCIKKITIVEDDDFDSIMIERKMLCLGNVHPFICKLFCTFETEGYLFFVMEYCAGGDLMFHVQKDGKFTEPRCVFYASEIICAIRFLHKKHIIYRDLKLDNILLDSDGHVRLVDFGMCQCRTYREELLPSNFCGTPEYISPEIIKGVPYNHSVDWWSFGVLLYEMAVGKMPFRGSDENELLWNVCYEQIHYPMFLTKELSTLLQSLLEREPTKRMGMATCKQGDICDQPWFRGVDWKAVEELRVKPPFVPEVTSKRDVQNFDTDFTESTPELSPIDKPTLERIDQSLFEAFPYTNPNISIFDQH